MPDLLVTPLGLTPYADALALMRAAAAARAAGALGEDLLLLVEHPPVLTLGRRAADNRLLAAPALLAARGVELHEVERGGGSTFHGPGQLVGYPIVDLKRHRRDLHWYLRRVEQALIDAVAEFGVAAGRNPPYTGVWTDPETSGGGPGPPGSAGLPNTPPALRKLASIGVHARDWVTSHGFALNVTPEPLGYFDLIVPCGIDGVEMTAVAREAPAARAGGVTVAHVADAVAGALGRFFDLRPVATEAAELRDRLEARSAAP
ncbi:octanoyltransferase [Gemmatimonadetes bacterium T265]|nr:octanoyltransferase [Gemmatimonadetes bacterium T265]